MAGRKKKLTKQQVVDALRQSHGLKTGAAEILGVSFPTIERYIADSEEAREVIGHWRKRRTERAMYKLDEAIERGESWAVALQLKNSKDGRDEGYSDRVDVTSGGDKLQAPVVIIEVTKNTEAEAGE